MMDDVDFAEDLEDCAALLSVCASLWSMRQRRTRRRSIGVIPLWQKRRELGDGHQLLEELRFNATMFFNYTRLTYERFDYLLGLCTPYLQKREMATIISAKERLAMTLRYLATGDSMHSLSFAYRCGFSTVSVIIRETLSTIVHVLHRLAVSEPQNKDAWLGIAQGFQQRWNLPHCLGAIDGRHMVIKSPSKSGSLYVNYKKTHSFVLMAVADSKYTFIVVDVGAEGSQNDAAILNNTEFWQRMKEGKLHIPEADFLPGSNKEMPYFFVGDGIFQLQEHLMKPFAVRKLTEEEAIYNYRISRARRVVENAFGILVARWQIFRTPLACSLETAQQIVLATICLHNFIMRSGEPSVLEEYNPPQFVDIELPDGSWTPGRWRSMVVGEGGALVPAPQIPRRSAAKATDTRKNLMDYVNNEGAVSWQKDRVHKGFWGAHIMPDIPEVVVGRLQEEAEDDAA